MSSIERVDGWRSSDGKIHPTEAAAQERQDWLDFQEWCANNFKEPVASKIWSGWHVSRRRIETSTE